MAFKKQVSIGAGLIVLVVAASASAGPQGRLGSVPMSGGGTLTCFGGSDIDWNELNFICNSQSGPPVGSYELFVYDPATVPAPVPFATFPVANPVGPHDFGLTDVPAYAGHVFDAGNMFVRANGLDGAPLGDLELTFVQEVRRTFQAPGDVFDAVELRLMSDPNSNPVLGGRPTAFTATSNKPFSRLEWEALKAIIFSDGFESGDTSAWSYESPTRPGRHTKSGVTIIPEDKNLPDPNLDGVATIFNTDGSSDPLQPAGCNARNYHTNNRDTGTRVCLGDGERFEATVDWTTPNGAGTGFAGQISPDHALFFFVDHEILVKVSDNCSTNDRFWVFASAATDVQYTLTVTDTQSGQTRTYGNELGQLAQPILDTSAFATCP